jgi:DNA-binding MarR family transcriptional regulator
VNIHWSGTAAGHIVVVEVYEAETYEPRRAVGRLVGRVRAELLAAMDGEFAGDRRLADLEVTAAQFVIIASLAIDGSASSASLCRDLSYDAGAMTRMLDRLESKGLIRRVRSEHDRRLVNLELTAAGLAMYPRLRSLSMKVLNRMLRGFTRAEVRQFEAFLDRVLQNART